MSSTDAAQVAHAILRDLTDALTTAEAAALRNEPDSIHSMRTVVRRLRSVLAAFAPLFDPVVSSDLRDRLKRVGVVLGDVRDLEVRAALAARALDELPSEFGGADARARLVDTAGHEHEQARVRALTYLRGRLYGRFREELHRFVEAAPTSHGESPPQAEELTRLIVRQQARRTLKRWKRARRHPDFPDRLTDLHEVRKAAKRLRYTAEEIDRTQLVEPSFSAIGAAAESVQDALGDHRDHVLYAEYLLFESKRAHADGESTFSFGVMHQMSLHSAEKALADAPSAIAYLKRQRRKLLVTVGTDLAYDARRTIINIRSRPPDAGPETS